VSWLDGLQRQRLASERRQELAQQRVAAGREQKRVAWERGFELVNAYAREVEAFLQPDLAELARKSWGDDAYVYHSSVSKAALPWEGGVMHHTCRWSARKKDAEHLGFEVSVIFEGDGRPRTLFVGSASMPAPPPWQVRSLRWWVQFRLRQLLKSFYVHGPETVTRAS
jgi:hypothetical protein